jgi:YD repeat-containing protein
VLDDGTTQLTKSDSNTRGQITKRIDPLGRETVYEYDATGLDFLRVKQKNGGSYDLLETRTYNTQHLPLTVTDAAGQTTTYTYNAGGQVLTVTNAKNETTSYTYNASGYLTTVTGPVSGATTAYTYDGYGRVWTCPVSWTLSQRRGRYHDDRNTKSPASSAVYGCIQGASGSVNARRSKSDAAAFRPRRFQACPTGH